jgi:uncharacterized protein YjbJ (UPF0337 family)
MHDKNFDQEKGGMKEFGGKVQHAAGDITGDEELQAKGSANETKGKAQNIFGKAKDAVGDAADKVKDALDPNSKDPSIDRNSR